MYEKDDMIYGDEPLLPRVQEVKAIEEYQLLLTFNNGEKKIFDFKPLLDFKPFKPLASKELFEKVRIAFGTISWGGNLDYCPDTLYLNSKNI